MTTKELKKILKNPKGKLICIDVDGTLTDGVYWGKGGPKPKPNKKMIELCNWLYDNLAHVIIYTARKRSMLEETEGWLILNGVQYHGVAFQRKPPADLYIDDMSINPNDI